MSSIADWSGGLAAAYVMLGVLSVSLHLYSRRSHWIKIMVTVLATVFMLVTYKSLPGLQGWPLTTDKLPTRLYLLAIEISGPDNIYLWARDMELGAKLQRPRAYKLPYSSKLHQQAVSSGRELRRNIAQIVEIDPAGKTVKAPGSSEVPVKQNVIRFLDAPQGLLPPKK